MRRKRRKCYFFIKVLCFLRKKIVMYMVLVSFLILFWCLFYDGNKILFLMKCKFFLFYFVKDYEFFRYIRRYYLYWKIFFFGECFNILVKINERIFCMIFFFIFMLLIDVFKNWMFIVLLWFEWLIYENMFLIFEFLLIDLFLFVFWVFLILEF